MYFKERIFNNSNNMMNRSKKSNYNEMLMKKPEIEYKVKIKEFYNIVYDTILDLNMEYIINKYPHKPTTLSVVRLKNWRKIFISEFNKSQNVNEYLISNKYKFKYLTIAIYEVKYLNCDISIILDKYKVNCYQFNQCINNKEYKICKLIADSFWEYRLNI